MRNSFKIMTFTFPIDDQSIVAIVSLVTGFLTSHGINYHLAKSKLDSFRKLIDMVDDYATNPAKSEESFQAMWAVGKQLVSKN